MTDPLPSRREAQTVVVVPQGGLCNRLRVVLSALSFAREFPNIRVKVRWGESKECRATFGDLFYALAADNFSISSRHWWETPQTRRNLHLPALLRRFTYSRQLVNFYHGTDGPLHEALPRASKAYVSTGSELKPYDAALARELRPQPELRQRIDCLTELFPEHIIGVHIRRTDNVKACAVSTTEAFCQAMERELAADPCVCFFLATDDGGLKEQLLKKYPGHIFIQDTAAMTRDTLSGMQEAVVDLFCLSHTSGVLGSYHSSFSETAAELGGVPLTIIGRP